MGSNFGSKIASQIELIVKSNSKEVQSSFADIYVALTDLNNQLGEVNSLANDLEQNLGRLQTSANIDTSEYEKFDTSLGLALAQVEALRASIGRFEQIDNPFNIPLDKPLETLMNHHRNLEKRINDVFGTKEACLLDYHRVPPNH